MNRLSAIRTAATMLAVVLASCVSRHQQPADAVAPTARIDTGRVPIAGGSLYYESVGSGSPVILIHGGNLDRRMWDPQFTILGREHRVVRYDARGFGRSSAANVPYMAHADLLALMDSLHIQRASLVGLSLGGRIAIDFALTNPTRVDRLVLASPGISGWRFSRGDTSWAPAWRAAAAIEDSLGMAVAWLGSDYMKPVMARPELRPRIVEWSSGGAHYWMGAVRFGDQEAEANPPALGRTGNIRAPTLVIVGARDVPDILKIADTLEKTVPTVRRLTLPNVGHMVNVEDSARFTPAVLEFLRSSR